MQPGIGDLHMLGLSGDEVLFVEDGLGLGVVDAQCGIHLAAAFDGLLVELVGAAFGAIEARLEVVADVKKQVDGAAGVGSRGQLFAVAGGFKVHHGGSGGEDTPVHRIGEGLLLRKAEAGVAG